MTTGYELWSTASRNLLYDFDTEDEALATIRELIVLNGPGTTDELALMYVDESHMMTIALGPALEAYVQQAARIRASSSG